MQPTPLPETNNVTTQPAPRNGPPISVTIHSAGKTKKINEVNTPPGFLFVVVNLTVDNHGKNDYMFNQQAVTITNGSLIGEDMYIRLTGHEYWGAIPPGEMRSGCVIFKVTNTTQNFTASFFYRQGKKSFPVELGIVQMITDSAIQ